MGKNSDLKNIFNSYMNNVVLNEAVKDTEEVSAPRQLTPEQQAAVQKIMSEKGYNKARAELMVLKGQEVINQKNAMQSQGIKPGTTVYTTPKGSASPISAQPVADNGTTVQPAPQPKTQPAPQPKTQPAPQPVQSQNNNTSNNEEEWDTVETQVVSSQPVATDDSGQVANSIQFPDYESVAMSDDEFEQNDEDPTDDEGYEEVETTVERIPNAVKTTSIAAGDDEFKDYLKIKQEKYNISKFLKHLSEKNYSSAHKYLKAILEQKVKRNILKGITKN
jgi:hypothetical protein